MKVNRCRLCRQMDMTVRTIVLIGDEPGQKRFKINVCRRCVPFDAATS